MVKVAETRRERAIGTEPKPDALTTELAIEASLQERLQHLAQARQQTVDHMVREAIVQYVEREEKREAFRQDTLQSLQEYVEWLRSWGTPEEKPAPTCHR